MFKTPRFLLSVLEGLVDGVLMLHPNGEILYANSPATEICRSLGSSLVPVEVWRSCEALLESRELFGDQVVVIESELKLNETQSYRIRVQWLEIDQENCLLVRLEDQQRSLSSLAITEAKRYGLTPREAEVWLLKRCNLSRKEIAARLYITIDTVKKHLGNIQLKRQAHSEEWC